MRIADMIKSMVYDDKSIKITPADSQSASVSERIKNEILSLIPGKTIQGEILDKNGNEVLIRLLGDIEISAKLDQDINLEIGRLITFEVKNNGKTLSLSPLLTNTANSDTVMKALNMAGIPINDKTIAMTEKMMQQGMSVDAKSLQGMFKDSLAFPNANVEDIVNLHKLNMPLNEANLGQMESYRNLTHELVSGMNDVIDEIPAAVLEVYDTEGVENALSMYKEILVENGLYNGSMTELPESVNAEELRGMDLASAREELVKFIANYSQLGREEQEVLFELTRHPAFQKMIKESFLEQWTLKPEMTENPKEIEKVYERMDRQLRSLQSIFTEHTVTADNPAVKAATNLSQNIDFLNQLNQMYTYVQLPLEMHSGEKNSELYVFTNKRSLASKEGAVSAMLHLDMDHLGPVDVYVTMQDSKVGTRFMVKNEEMLDFLGDHMHILTERLSKRGYTLKCEMKLLGEDVHTNPVEALIKSERSNEPVIQYGFDVRA